MKHEDEIAGGKYTARSDQYGDVAPPWTSPKNQDGDDRQRGYRLPPSDVGDLKAIFCELEAEAGLQAQDMNATHGVADIEDDGTIVRLHAQERFVHRRELLELDSRGRRLHPGRHAAKRAREARAREAIEILIDSGGARHVSVLMRVYGEAPPGSRHMAWGRDWREVGTLADLTGRVQRRMREVAQEEAERELAALDAAMQAHDAAAEEIAASVKLERDRMQRLLVRARTDRRRDHVRRVMVRFEENVRRSAATRRETPDERERRRSAVYETALLRLVPREVVRQTLDAPAPVKRDGESKASLEQRKATAKAMRSAFIAGVRVEAFRLLSEASWAYRQVRLALTRGERAIPEGRAA